MRYKGVVIVVLLLLLAGMLGAKKVDATPSLAHVKVCLDPGHGGSDPGAVNEDFVLHESEINLDVSYGLKALLEGDGATVVMTRSGNEYLTNSDRYTFCNSEGATILVSVHTNSTTDTRMDGSMALYFHSDDRALAQAIYSVMYPALRDTAPDPANFTDYGLDRFASGVLMKSDMPAAMMEPLLMSHPGEAALLTTRIYSSAGSGEFSEGCTDYACRRGQIAQSLYEGVLSYFAVADNPPADPISLSVIATKVKGAQVADLSWSGSVATTIDVYRDGGLIATAIANNGTYTDETGQKGAGSASYQICEAGTAVCSNIVTVNW